MEILTGAIAVDANVSMSQLVASNTEIFFRSIRSRNYFFCHNQRSTQKNHSCNSSMPCYFATRAIAMALTAMIAKSNSEEM